MSRQRFSASRYNIRGIVESPNLFLFVNKTLKKLRCKQVWKVATAALTDYYRLLLLFLLIFLQHWSNGRWQYLNNIPTQRLELSTDYSLLITLHPLLIKLDLSFVCLSCEFFLTSRGLRKPVLCRDVTLKSFIFLLFLHWFSAAMS